MELTTELQRIYDSEINVSISWFWDGGIDVRLGDAINGFPADENVPSIKDILPWLQEAIAHFYPDSTYARSLEPHVRERAKSRVFRPPQAGAQVRCPHCGSPNAAPPGITELIEFTCSHCGLTVRVEPPAVQ
jgi:hypothetical protein